MTGVSCYHCLSLWCSFFLFTDEDPVNMADPIQKHFGYSQLWPLRPVCSQNRAGSDFPHPFQFHFSKEGMGHTVQNQPRSGLDGLVRVWPYTFWSGRKLVCRNHQAWFLAGHNRPATSVPFLRLCCVLRQMSWII